MSFLNKSNHKKMLQFINKRQKNKSSFLKVRIKKSKIKKRKKEQKEKKI
jgi:hypothetical protein